jgi:hypothetical protein
VIYTDGLCEQGTKLETVITPTKTSAYAVTPAAPDILFSSSGTPSTSWAAKRVVRQSHPDTESIREARVNALASDRLPARR